MSRLTQLRTYARLGLRNVIRVAAYRLGLKSGRHPVQRLTAPVPVPPFLRAAEQTGHAPPPNTAWDGALWWFGWYRQPLPEAPPDWFANPFSETPQVNAELDWWRIPDFGSGDIKGLWELSRFDWVVAWSTNAAHGDDPALKRLNLWLSDWARRNPPYKGPNWKCGQEAAIRVIHLVTAAWILGQDRTPQAGFVDLLVSHLQRIAPTISYAIGQQNNHGTSEAAALFIGGSFVTGHDPRADAWMRKGRRWLEERAATLIAPDGSFSQYSVTYHRMMLDSYSLAEAWRRHRDLPVFSRRLRTRLMAAMRWLEAMTDKSSGDAPNIGANDGAHLLQLTGSEYRDFRPSVQLAAALFGNVRVYPGGLWDLQARWLGVPIPAAPASPLASRQFDDGGFTVLRVETVAVWLRYPRFRFRPSQADALHVDLWVNGANLLCDGGSFSYNANAADTAYFSGTGAHNTVQFDDRDQMPRLSRFLFGQWLHAQDVIATKTEAAAGYTDAEGATHHRHVSLAPGCLRVTDTVAGFARHAILRWRLPQGEWTLDDQDGTAVRLSGPDLHLSVATDDTPMRARIVAGRTSLHYLQQQPVSVLEITVLRETKITSEVAW